MNNKTSYIQSLNSLLVKTEIPIKIKKEEKTIIGYAVNWADNTTLTEIQLHESFSKFNKREKETQEIKKSVENKIENTLIFYKKFGGKK